MRPLASREFFYRFVRDLRAAFGNGPPEPEDIAQGAIEKLLAQNSTDHVRDPQGYLWRVAQNLIVSELRSRHAATARESNYSALFSATDGYLLSPERVLASEGQLAVALQTLEAMPETRRRAFELVRVDGLSHREAAKRLGVSRPAVSKQVARAVADLYAALAAGEEGTDSDESV
ncbi:MAG: sigma-70 family RNA polymerase sigma factor [Pseudomonadota bacterium]